MPEALTSSLACCCSLGVEDVCLAITFGAAVTPEAPATGWSVASIVDDDTIELAEMWVMVWSFKTVSLVVSKSQKVQLNLLSSGIAVLLLISSEKKI